MLIDRCVATRLSRNDYRRRPLAVYGSWQAAKHAATRAAGDARWRGRSVVLFLPTGFPASLGKPYEQASSLGFA